MPQELKQVESLIQSIYHYACSSNRSGWTPIDAYLKGIEEEGELSEAVMVVTGRLGHKTLNEHFTGEISDNINQLIDTLSFADNYPALLMNISNLTTNDLMDYVASFEEEVELLENIKIDYLSYVALKTFKQFHRTKYQFDEEKDLLKFNVLIERLVILNFLLFAISNDGYYDAEEASFYGFDDESFEKANLCLFDTLNKKFEKWQSVENCT